MNYELSILNWTHYLYTPPHFRQEAGYLLYKLQSRVRYHANSAFQTNSKKRTKCPDFSKNDADEYIFWDIFVDLYICNNYICNAAMAKKRKIF